MTTAQWRPTLLSLPEEVLTTIVSCLTDQALVELTQACKKLNRICSSPLEMRQRCMRYQWWEDRHEIEKKKSSRRTSDVNWRDLFFHRFRVQVLTVRLLSRIIENPIHHIVNFNKIAEFGYDAKDCLKAQAEVKDDEVDDPLARRYHATAAICYIRRRRALAIWTRVREYNDVPLEVGLLALELFLPSVAFPDTQDVVRDLDDLAAQFLSVTPDFEALSTEESATALIAWMWAQGFKGTCPGHYCALKNVFVGMTIRTIRTATPLTLVAIFCALARRVGLKAHPCGYPGHVLAIVEEPNTGEYQYYDVFPGPGVDPRTDRARLIDTFIGDTQTLTTVLSPARTSLMIARAAQNIISTLQLPEAERMAQNYGYPDICERATLYAALTAVAVLKPGPGPVASVVVHQLTRQISLDYPMDVRLLEEELPKVSAQVLVERVCGALRAEDSTPRIVNTRHSSENKHILYPKHRVGTVFRHKRYDYCGAIFGWTNTCKPPDGEEWISQMRVDKLPRARNQPFYHVLVDDSTVRYVAEENIAPFKPDNVDDLILLAGKYFKRFDKETGMFVSNMKTEFPDD